MTAARHLLDSNVLLRFLTGDPPAMAEAAASLLGRAERGEVILELSPLVLAETAFTLESFFKKPRKAVAATLGQFVLRSGVRLSERERLLDALRRVEQTGVHLVDAYLAASAAETGLPVASFDRDLDRFQDVQRYEPKA